MYRRYKKSTNDNFENSPVQLILGFVILGILLAFLNKKLFWSLMNHYVIPFIIFALICVGIYIYYLRKKKQKLDYNFEKTIQQIKNKGFSENINNFIERFGKEGKSEIYTYRGYNFDDSRFNDFLENFIKNDIGIKKDNNEYFFEIIKYFIDQKEKEFLNKRIEAKTSHNINELGKNGDDFENLIVRLYNAMGYVSKRIGGHGDQGGDVIASKDGENILIQAKCYQGSVGNAAVQQATAAMPHYGCTKAVVATTSYFTLEAVSLAKSNNVELVDGEMLKHKLLEYLKESWQ